MPASLRIEVFVDDLDTFVDFYIRVLGFDLAEDRRTDDRPYAAVFPRRHPDRRGPTVENRRRGARDVPTGVEIVIEVDDVHADHARVTGAGWPLAEPLRAQPWGLTDFRVHDPDGHYVRITSRG